MYYTIVYFSCDSGALGAARLSTYRTAPVYLRRLNQLHSHADFYNPTVTISRSSFPHKAPSIPSSNAANLNRQLHPNGARTQYVKLRHKVPEVRAHSPGQMNDNDLLLTQLRCGDRPSAVLVRSADDRSGNVRCVTGPLNSKSVPHCAETTSCVHPARIINTSSIKLFSIALEGVPSLGGDCCTWQASLYLY